MGSYAGFGAGEFGALGGSITFEWTKPGPNEYAARFMTVAGYLENLTKPLLAAKAIAIADMENHFDTETGPDGQAWAPLDPEYAAKRGSEHPILQLTGAMHDAAVSPSAYPVEGDALFFSTAGLPDYWEFHQDGTGGGQHVGARQSMKESSIASGDAARAHESMGVGRGGALPARPFVGISEEAELQIVEVFDMWFDEGVSILVGGGGIVQSRGAGGRFGPKLFPRF